MVSQFMDTKYGVGVCFLDFNRADDIVNHNIMRANIAALLNISPSDLLGLEFPGESLVPSQHRLRHTLFKAHQLSRES